MKWAMSEEKKSKACTWLVTGILFAVVMSIGALLYIVRAASIATWDSEVDKTKLVFLD